MTKSLSENRLREGDWHNLLRRLAQMEPVPDGFRPHISIRGVLLAGLLAVGACGLAPGAAPAAEPADRRDAADFVAGELVNLNDNGAWSWFMDERAIAHDGKLIVGSVRAVGDFRSGRDDPHWGNVEVAVHDLQTGHTGRVVLHEHFEQDDHDGPAFLALPDGRLLAAYTRHGTDLEIYFRHSAPRDPLTWGEP